MRLPFLPAICGSLLRGGLPLLVAFTLQLDARAAEEPSLERKANLKRVEALLAERQAKPPADAAAVFLRRGLVADRAARTVTLDAEATGLQARGVVEFVVIAENSGHDYEALFTTFAKPSDVSAALEFIGVPRGHPANPAAMAFWPKGERVRITVSRPDGPPRAIEELILDLRNQEQVLPVQGFVHAGSVWSELDGKPHCAADDVGPGSVASSYNEPTTVLDGPRQAGQGDVYERFVANPETLFTKGEFVRLELTPEVRPPEQPRRVVDLVLSVTAPDSAPEIAAARFRLVEAGQSPDAAPALQITDAILACRAYLPLRDPYVTLDLSDRLSLRAAVDLARLLSVIDTEEGIRVEAPKTGQLYYKAFLPRPTWRDRAERPTQPCELRFARGADGAVAVTLVRVEEVWDANPDNLRPDLKPHEQAVKSPAELPAALAATGVALPVLLVFAPGDLTLEAVMPYLRAVLGTHPNVHVFVNE